MIWTTSFWKGVAERAIKTFAQALVALIAGQGLGLVDVNWLSVLSVAGLATLASVLTSIGNADFVAGSTTPTAVAPKVADDGTTLVGDHAAVPLGD